MTYAELAAARSISRPSAARLVRRRKWRRQTDNAGIVRIMVPAEDAERAELFPGYGFLADVARSFEAALTAFRERAEAAEKRADAAEVRADRADARAETALQAADELRQAEAARRALGLLARLRAAWQGE